MRQLWGHLEKREEEDTDICLYNVAPSQPWGEERGISVSLSVSALPPKCLLLPFAPETVRLTTQLNRIRYRDKEVIFLLNPDQNWVHLNWESNDFTGVPVKNGILHHACAFFKASYCHYMACECKGMLRSWLSEMCQGILAPLKKWELLIGSCIKEFREGSEWLNGLSSLFTQILVKVLTKLREEKARVWIIDADAGKLDLNNQSRYSY